MADFDYTFKNDKFYDIGTHIGYFAAFLVFASIFYLIMTFFNKIPQAVKYYHVLLFVIILSAIRFLALRFRK